MEVRQPRRPEALAPMANLVLVGLGAAAWTKRKLAADLFVGGIFLRLMELVR